MILRDEIFILLRFFRFVFEVNWSKTFYLNFSTQPILKAIKLPIIVFGSVKIYSLRGKVEILAPVTTGMVQLGKDLDHNPVSLCPIKLNIQKGGVLRFRGRALISGGSTVTSWGGLIELGKNVSVGSGTQLKSIDSISIGDNSQLVALCTVMDTDVHYVKNVRTGIVKRASLPIAIGKNCWLGQGTIVGKGVVVPDYCITGRNTFLNKNYKDTLQANSLLAGTPAKLISNDVQRIFDFDKEVTLNRFFLEKPEADYTKLEPGFFEEPNEVPRIFKLL